MSQHLSNSVSAGRVLVEDVGRVRVLTLDNEAKLNSFDRAMLTQLTGAIIDADRDPNVGAIVVTGAGRAFCAGGDTSAMGSDMSATDSYDFLVEFVHPVKLALVESSTPTIAMINGAAVGAGLSIALACDLRVCVESAVLSAPYVRAGLVAGDGSAWLLPRLVGMGRALDLILTGRRISPDEALSWGLVNRVTAAVDLREETLALAATIADLPSRAVGESKRLIADSLNVSLRQALPRGGYGAAALQAGIEHRAVIEKLRGS